jgi:hypothetical protein
VTCHSTAARVVKDHEPSGKDEDMDPTTTLQRFEKQKTVLLTTYKRDGSGVGTPVNLAVEGEHAFFRTYDRSWKAKRLRRNQTCGSHRRRFVGRRPVTPSPALRVCSTAPRTGMPRQSCGISIPCSTD